MTPGPNIRRLRQSRGLSLKQLSEECGQDAPRLSRIENGQDNLLTSTLHDIAKALDTKPGLLLNPELQEP